MDIDAQDDGVLHPMIEELLRDGKTKTWPQLAKEHGLPTGDAAQKKWERFAKSQKIPHQFGKLEYKPPPIDWSKYDLKKFTTDENDNPKTKYYGEKTDFFKDITKDNSNIEILGGTQQIGGAKQQWVRWKETRPPLEELTPEQRKAFEERRHELESSQGQHTYQNSVQLGSTQNWVIIGCAHFPGHNRKIWYGLLRYISEHKIDGFIFAGDALDIRSLSAHDKGNVRDITLWQEYEQCLEPFNELHSVLPTDCKKVFLRGNHEDRYSRILREAENSRFGDALLSPESAMKLPENGWQILRNWKEDYVALTPDLDVFHGNRLGDNPSQKELKDCILANRSAIFFHTHRYGIASNGRIAAYNCGLLGDIDHDVFKYESWRVRQHWQNGFCIASILDDGSHFVNPVRCSKNGFVLDGRFYGG